MVEARRRPAEVRLEAMPSHWMMLTRNVDVLVTPGLRAVRAEPALDEVAAWTDEHVSLFPLLKHGNQGNQAGEVAR